MQARKTPKYSSRGCMTNDEERTGPLSEEQSPEVFSQTDEIRIYRIFIYPQHC
jgi:hypothetical protein